MLPWLRCCLQIVLSVFVFLHKYKVPLKRIEGGINSLPSFSCSAKLTIARVSQVT